MLCVGGFIHSTIKISSEFRRPPLLLNHVIHGNEKQIYLLQSLSVHHVWIQMNFYALQHHTGQHKLNIATRNCASQHIYLKQTFSTFKIKVVQLVLMQTQFEKETKKMKRLHVYERRMLDDFSSRWYGKYIFLSSRFYFFRRTKNCTCV